jgi:DNA-binding Lrp family transcriptional regulator
MNNLTKIERQILQIIQSDFPLTAKPYEEIGKSTGLSEQKVITILTSLKKRNILREICAIFNARYLGFTSALISFQVNEHRIDAVAQIINQHPGVSHNYQREHPYNLWFTLSVPQELEINKHVHTLATMTSCPNYLYLPSVKVFKRHVHLDILDHLNNPRTITQASGEFPRMSSKITISPEVQREIMSELQKDLSLSPTPFKDMAKRFDVKEKMFFNFLEFLKTTQKMSRFAGILKHRNLGFTANAMVVWNIPPHKVQAFVDHAITYRAISHCYERVVSPEWPYNIYTMIHGKSRVMTQGIIDDLSSRFAITSYEVLYSGKEYKKQRVNYFSEDIYEWHKLHISKQPTS